MTASEAKAWLRQHGVVIVHRDNHILGVNKPAGLLSQPGPDGVIALPEVIERYRQIEEGKPGRAYVGLVHRLDRNVSGVLAIAKTSKAAARMSALFRDRDDGLQKIYLAWVQGGPRDDLGRLEHQAVRRDRVTRCAAAGDRDAKTARLRFRVEARTATLSRLRVTLETGLPHQIRFQLAEAGMPILGDVKYGATPTGGAASSRPALHASELRFPHPVSGEPVVLRAPLPADLAALDARLSGA